MPSELERYNINEFERLYLENEQNIKGTVFKIVRSFKRIRNPDQQAEDIIQDISKTIIRNGTRFENREHLIRYFAKAAKHSCFRIIRSSTNKNILFSELISPEGKGVEFKGGEKTDQGIEFKQEQKNHSLTQSLLKPQRIY